VDPTTLFLVGMFLLVASAVIVGELFIRIGQAALVGQILVGIILGPTVLGDPLGLTALSSSFQTLDFLATFLILMLAGLSVTPEQIRATGLSAGLLGIAIFLVPFLTGAGLVHLLFPSLSWLTGMFVALTISITALPVLAIMLREFDLIESRFGSFLLNTSVVNELAAVSTFAVLLRIQAKSGSTVLDGITAVMTVGVFLSTILAVHFGLRTLRQLKVWDRLVNWFRTSWRSRESWFALLIVVGLAAALYSQFLGLTFLVGAFYAGLLITPESAGRRQHRQITQTFNIITWGFFIPFFFAYIGFQMDFTQLGVNVALWFGFVALAIFAFFSKVFVGAGVARSLGWSGNESLCAGFLVSSRGAVELAMAVILLGLGVFSTQLFTIVAGVGVITTVLSPIGARSFVRSITADRRAREEEARRAKVEVEMPHPILIGRDESPNP